MNLSHATQPVNRFEPIRLLAVRPTPESPNHESFVDIELFGIIQIRQLKIARDRFGRVRTGYPETSAYRTSGRPTAAFWIANPALRIQFNAAIEAALDGGAK